MAGRSSEALRANAACVPGMKHEPVKSAARALKLLELFRDSRAPLRLNQIGAGLSCPPSSANALVKSLVRMGYLNFNRTARTYFPTTKVATLGDWINADIYAGGKLLQMIEKVHRLTGETVTLVAQNDVNVQYLKVIDSIHAVRYHFPEGSMRLITNVSAGFALMSRLDDAQIERLCRAVNAQTEDRTKRVVASSIRQRVAEVRKLGYCFLVGMPFAEGGAISMALPEEVRGIPLAVAVGGTKDRITSSKAAIVAALTAVIAETFPDRPLQAAGWRPAKQSELPTANASVLRRWR